MQKNEKFKDVFLNEYGYYELEKLMDAEEHRRIFEEEYFQNSMSNYEKVYSDNELLWIENKLEQKQRMLEKYLKKERPSILDIGCGEGFVLSYFKKRGYDITGIDYSLYGVNQHNPQIIQYVHQGDCEEIIPKFISEGRKFDIINMDSVLDMMLHPKNILGLLGEIMEENGVLLIKVANNYSMLQTYLYEKGRLADTYWLDKQGHPSYFNREGLIRLLQAFGYSCLDTFGESFIDLNLLNEDTNYYEKKDAGKNCYKAKVELENIMHRISPEKSLEVFRILGEMGLGREIIGIFRK
ncbi:MAG: class I SAM-dependent methyltransferase [Acetivibrio ethanolgignens]